MKEIKITEENFPSGKINLQQLSQELGTDRIMASLGGGTVKRQWVEFVDGESIPRTEEIVEPPSITVVVPRERDTAEVVAIVKAHNPAKSTEEESMEKEKQGHEEKLANSSVIKSLIARIEALEKVKK